MSALGVHSPCTSECISALEPQAPAPLRARRWSSTMRALFGVLPESRKLTEPGVLSTRAHRVLAGLDVCLDTDIDTLRVPGTRGTLIVANHISWLDIVAILGIEPVTFLSKREVGTWPVFGSLAHKAGTRFLERSGLHELPSTVRNLAETLRSGESVMVFPEATTWCSPPGGQFRRATFQAAIDAGAPVLPVTIDYFQHGMPSKAAAFVGEDTMLTSLRRVVAASALTVRVRAHAPLAPGHDRRRLAAEAQAVVRIAETPAHV